MNVDALGGDRHGVLYVATGHAHVAEALRSARSVKHHCPDLAVHLFADSAGLDWVARQPAVPFASVGRVTDVHLRSKIDYLARTPFERTLYLDADTRVRENVSELFELLDRFDIAIGHAHRRNHPDTTQTWRTAIPASFPQFNSGVLAYRRSDAVMRLFEQWRRSFREAGFRKDQVTLRELLWLCDLRIATLPPEYNVRYRKYLFLWREDEARPRILHLAKRSPMRRLVALLRSRESGRRLVGKIKSALALR